MIKFDVYELPDNPDESLSIMWSIVNIRRRKENGIAIYA